MSSDDKAKVIVVAILSLAATGVIKSIAWAARSMWKVAPEMVTEVTKDTLEGE